MDDSRAGRAAVRRTISIRSVPLAGREHRWVVGIDVASDLSMIRAALVAARGRGLEIEPQVVATAAARIAEETTGLFRRLAVEADQAPGLVGILASQLALTAGELVDEVSRAADASGGDVLAVAVHDPGLWAFGDGGFRSCLSLCDAPRLAERTGQNVIDAFPQRDLAQMGLGGPVTATAQWILCSEPDRYRALLDLGRSVRITSLPAPNPAGDGVAGVLSFDVGPGTALLDRLAQQLTGGQQRFDPGGMLAVQGRRIERLYDHWLADPYFDRPLPRWHPHGVLADRFLAEVVPLAVEAGWSIRDMLCTATHLVAESISRAVVRWLPAKPRLDGILLTGGGRHNGMLLREIAARLPDVPLADRDEAAGGDRLPAAAAALLGLLHIDQIPAGQIAVTGARIPRVLGRLTPGTPQNWHRLVQALATATTDRTALRNAV